MCVAKSRSCKMRFQHIYMPTVLLLEVHGLLEALELNTLSSWELIERKTVDDWFVKARENQNLREQCFCKFSIRRSNKKRI